VDDQFYVDRVDWQIDSHLILGIPSFFALKLLSADIYILGTIGTNSKLQTTIYIPQTHALH
jgi:hypothetical protein